MLNDEDSNKANWESDHTPVLSSAADNDADRNDDGSAMTTEQINRVTDAQSIIADILADAEDDLYGRDGNTNDSDLAGQRLQAMAGRLVGAFAQVASGLSLVIAGAKQKIENAEKSDALIESQNQQEKKKQEEADEAKDNLEEALDDSEKIRKLDQEREEWSRSKHSYAGIEMTGEEWGEFADQLKGDTPLRKWLLEKLKKDGKSDAEAKEMADQMALLAKMQNLPPSHWTPEMKALDERLKADPKLKREFETRLNEVKKAEHGVELAPETAEKTASIAKSEMDSSASNRADALSQASGSLVTSPAKKTVSYAPSLDDPAIASPLNLTEHHHAALQAKEPLDAPKQVAALPLSPTTAPAPPGGGFDV